MLVSSKGIVRHLLTGSLAEQSFARSTATAEARSDAKMPTIGAEDFNFYSPDPKNRKA